MDKLQLAYKHCEQIIKDHSATFYRAFSLLPSEHKKAVWAVYGFCRLVDDIVDEGSAPETELLQFEESFEKHIYYKEPTNDLVWTALQDVFARYNMDIEAFRDMIKGQKMDVEGREINSINELLDYSYHVASTVGLMLLPILAPTKTDELRSDAIALGLGMQITNILRDIGEDTERGRIYLPKQLLQKYHYSITDLHNGVVDDRFKMIWEELAILAEQYYEKALSTINLYPITSRTPVKGAAYLYRAILSEIRKNDYRIYSERFYVSKESKEKILASM